MFIIVIKLPPLDKKKQAENDVLVAKPDGVCRNWIEGLMYAHDKVNKAHSVGGVGVRGVQALSPADDSILERLSHYGEANVKIVRIEKSTTEPLGATVKVCLINLFFSCHIFLVKTALIGEGLFSFVPSSYSLV